MQRAAGQDRPQCNSERLRLCKYAPTFGLFATCEPLSNGARRPTVSRHRCRLCWFVPTFGLFASHWLRGRAAHKKVDLYGLARASAQRAWPRGPGRRAVAARRAGHWQASREDILRGRESQMTSPPGVPPGPRATLWRTLCVQVCTPTGVDPRLAGTGPPFGGVGSYSGQRNATIFEQLVNISAT